MCTISVPVMMQQRTIGTVTNECNQIPTVGVAMGPCCEMYNMASTVGLVVGRGAPVFSLPPRGWRRWRRPHRC